MSTTLKCTFIFTSLIVFQLLSAQSHHDPTFEEVISLQSLSSAVISPDGHHVIYEVQSADWKENRYDRELWISKNGMTPFQLTNNLQGSSNRAKWSPDGNWIAFLSKEMKKLKSK